MIQVRGYGGFKPLLLITWALEEVRARSSPPVAPTPALTLLTLDTALILPSPQHLNTSKPQHLNTSTLSSHTPLLPSTQHLSTVNSVTPHPPPDPPSVTLRPPQVRETLESDDAVQDGHAVPLAANLTWARFQVACPPSHQYPPTSPT